MRHGGAMTLAAEGPESKAAALIAQHSAAEKAALRNYFRTAPPLVDSPPPSLRAGSGDEERPAAHGRFLFAVE